MRISVLTDESGRIIGTMRPIEPAGSGPTHVRMTAGAGQKVLEVVLPEELSHLRSLVSLHDTHVVEIDGQEAHLVARKVMHHGGA